MCRGTNITDTADSDVVSNMSPSGPTHSMEGVVLSACCKVTLQMRVRVFPAMERPELVIVTTGSSGTACGEGGMEGYGCMLREERGGREGGREGE